MYVPKDMGGMPELLVGNSEITADGSSSASDVDKTRNALPAFIAFLQQLENDGICELLHDEVPARFEGVSGWTVHEDKMDDWRRRREAWFMKGKPNRLYKPASFYQFLRRLGYFPTETTKRATHGLDFEGSKTFKWDGSHRTKYIQSKREKETLSREISRRSIIHCDQTAMPHVFANPQYMMNSSWLPSGPFPGYSRMHYPQSSQPLQHHITQQHVAQGQLNLNQTQQHVAQGQLNLNQNRHYTLPVVTVLIPEDAGSKAAVLAPQFQLGQRIGTVC